LRLARYVGRVTAAYIAVLAFIVWRLGGTFTSFDNPFEVAAACFIALPAFVALSTLRSMQIQAPSGSGWPLATFIHWVALMTVLAVLLYFLATD
jgi:low affinity Fe/Cu permease